MSSICVNKKRTAIVLFLVIFLIIFKRIDKLHLFSALVHYLHYGNSRLVRDEFTFSKPRAYFKSDNVKLVKIASVARKRRAFSVFAHKLYPVCVMEKAEFYFCLIPFYYKLFTAEFIYGNTSGIAFARREMNRYLFLPVYSILNLAVENIVMGFTEQGL